MAADEEFARAVEDGMRLAKRIQYGKDRPQPPPSALSMERSSAPAASFLPLAPMVYAVIVDPGIVDNPDIPSYQPYVYGLLEPPALIPLHMAEIFVEVECFLDVAFVTVRGRWRVHCVTRSKSCDCRLAVPMGEQGSILGVEVEVGRTSYSTQVIEPNEDQNTEKIAKSECLGFLKPQLFSLIIPQVNGGSDIWVAARWSQKLMYKDGQFSVAIPFNFPDYVNPWVKIFSKREKIHLNVSIGTGKEILLQKTSHPLKEKSHQAGKLAFFYEADVESWSTRDFYFSYTVYSNDLFGGILLQSPTLLDNDQRDMFCLYLFPGIKQSKQVFKKEVVFIVDVSGSMQGKPLENVRSAMSAALLELKPGDYFDIISFNDELRLFSSRLEPATEDMVVNANQWISKNFIAGGGTDIMHPLNEALNILSSTQGSMPHIFLITDGSVEDERNICHTMKTHLAKKGSIPTRISTFGIGTYCNHYFLRMLASLGRGQYDAAYDPDSIEIQLQQWLERASSPILANITIDTFNNLDEFEVFPFPIPDLSAACPLIISGRCPGKFPDSLKAKGSLADMSDITIDLKVENTKDFPLEKAFAKQQVDLLTAHAWFSESKQLEQKVAKLSMRSGIPSEYTVTVLLQTDTEPQAAVQQAKKNYWEKYSSQKERLPILVKGLTMGFGNITATKENLPAGFGERKVQQSLDIYINKAVGCCSRMADCCCCMCFIKMCSKLNDRCVIAITQLCAALSCLGCLECCSELCCGGPD